MTSEPSASPSSRHAVRTVNLASLPHFFDNMRLIHAASLQLERFDDDAKVPPYAILSHTWGGQEISLQQFEDAYKGDENKRSQVKRMLGYAKIVRACEQALRDGYGYAWVDTCQTQPTTPTMSSF